MKKDFMTPLFSTLFLLICAYGATSWGLFLVALTDYPVRAILIAVNLVFMAFASFIIVKIDRLDRKPRNIFLDIMDAVDEKEKRKSEKRKEVYSKMEVYDRIAIKNEVEYDHLMKYLEDQGRLMRDGTKPTKHSYEYFTNDPRATEVVVTNDGIVFAFWNGVGCLSEYNQMYDSLPVQSLIEYFHKKDVKNSFFGKSVIEKPKKVVSEETRRKLSEKPKKREAKKRENKGK